jgi:hypothetical protein
MRPNLTGSCCLKYEPLWREAWAYIETALESFERGSSRVEEQNGLGLSLVALAPEIFGPAGFNPARQAAPFTAISHHARGQLYLIATPFGGGWSYRVDYPYYSWAETVARPRIERKDFGPLVARLNELEGNAVGRWVLDDHELSSAFKFMSEDRRLAASNLAPERVVEEMRAALSREQETAAGVQLG